MQDDLLLFSLRPDASPNPLALAVVNFLPSGEKEPVYPQTVRRGTGGQGRPAGCHRGICPQAGISGPVSQCDGAGDGLSVQPRIYGIPGLPDSGKGSEDMNGRFWKWINRIFATGIWLQPFVMAGLILFFRAVFGQRPSILSLFFLSWLPSVYVWSENQRQRAAGKTEFGIEDIFHDRPTQYESPLKMQAMYPKVDERFLFDAPESSVWKNRVELSPGRQNTCANRWKE